MLTKEECEKALNNLNELSCFPGNKEGVYYPMLYQLIQEHFDPQPYKFEDLKPNMWVWDDKNEMFILITFIDKQFKKMHVCLTEYDGFNDEYVNVEYTEYFEEERFFPVTKAMEYQE